MSLKEKNKRLANELKEFLEKNELHTDTRIYFNGMAYDHDYKVGKYVVLEDVKPSDYFDYANNETVSISFEGMLYHVLNYGELPNLHEEFHSIFERHNCYFEFGNAWNLSVYYDD